ncbi:MAG: TGS domain-containing protein, partial [Candidatus Diapherotrites archaeon]|nr:TGS domain-containing protein [Candidatus Diapherotrites archaeon]
IICKDIETKKEVEKKCKGKILVVPDFNAISAEELNNFKKGLFQFLGKILIYTKKPGQEANMEDPLILNQGITVEQVASYLHKDLAKNLKYVKVWGSAKFEGQRVNKDYVLQNNDIIEIVS